MSTTSTAKEKFGFSNKDIATYIIIFREDIGVLRRTRPWLYENLPVILGRKFELSHYPFLCYEGEHAGVIQLFGHVHSGGEDEGFDIPRLQYLLPFQYDVGIDNNNDWPVSLMKILEMFPFDPGPTIDLSAKMYPYLINEVQAIAGDYGLDFPAEVLLNDIDLGYARSLRIRGEAVGYFAIVSGGS